MNEIVIAVIAAIVYAIAGYFKSGGSEHFEPPKFVATIAVGAIVGLLIYAKGSPLTEEAVETQFIAYAGLVVLIENFLKGITRWFKNA